MYCVVISEKIAWLREATLYTMYVYIRAYARSCVYQDN